MTDRSGRPVRSLAQNWFGFAALVALIGLVIEIFVTANYDASHFATPLSRVFNMLFYFTILSNIITLVMSALLFVRLDRTSMPFKVVRLSGLLGITVTGLVYHAALAGAHHPTGWGWVGNLIVHYIVPIMAVVGWLIFGPRGLTSRRIAMFSIVFPAVYFVVTLIRGPIVHWYPYPFLDVDAHGYGRVLVNCVLVAIVFFAVAFGAALLDNVLTRILPKSVQPAGR